LRGRVGVGLRDPAVLEQAVDDIVATFYRPVAVADRVESRRRFWQGREIRRLGDRQFVDRFVEIDQRCRSNPVSPEAKRDLVEIEFENLVLGIGALEPHRQQGFVDLAGERHLTGKKEVLHDLLCNGRGALRPAVGAKIPYIQKCGPRHALIVDAAMLVEILVLGRQKRVDDQFWNRLDRQIQPALLGIFAEQRAIRGMNACHHRAANSPASPWNNARSAPLPRPRQPETPWFRQ
jgi:hypothetical protein